MDLGANIENVSVFLSFVGFNTEQYFNINYIWNLNF